MEQPMQAKASREAVGADSAENRHVLAENAACGEAGVVNGAGLPAAGTHASLDCDRATLDLDSAVDCDRAKEIAAQIDAAVVGKDARSKGVDAALLLDAPLLLDVLERCSPHLLRAAEAHLCERYGYRLETAISKFPVIDRIGLERRLEELHNSEEKGHESEGDGVAEQARAARIAAFFEECCDAFRRFSEVAPLPDSAARSTLLRSVCETSAQFEQGAYRDYADHNPADAGVIRKTIESLSDGDCRNALGRITKSLHEETAYFRSPAAAQIIAWLRDGYVEQRVSWWNTRSVRFVNSPEEISSSAIAVPGSFPTVQEALSDLAAHGTLPGVISLAQRALLTAHAAPRLGIALPFLVSIAGTQVLNAASLSLGLGELGVAAILMSQIGLIVGCHWSAARMAPKNMVHWMGTVSSLVRSADLTAPAYVDSSHKEAAFIKVAALRTGAEMHQGQVEALFSAVMNLAALGLGDREVLRIARRDAYDPSTRTYPKIQERLNRELGELGFHHPESQHVFLAALRSARALERLHLQATARRVAREALGIAPA